MLGPAWTDCTEAAHRPPATTHIQPPRLSSGPQAFRARGLDLGASYVFCVRQRNDVGWSAFSEPSPIVTTTTTLPPTRPVALLTNAYDAVIQWEQDVKMTFVDFKVQVGTLPPNFGASGDGGRPAVSQLALAEVTWKAAMARRLAGEQLIGGGGDMKGNGDGVDAGAGDRPGSPGDGGIRDGLATNVTQVFLQQLSPGSVYVARVKVQSIAGWSVYSDASDPFRTPSAP